MDMSAENIPRMTFEERDTPFLCALNTPMYNAQPVAINRTTVKTISK